jgi:hypothetical protein
MEAHVLERATVTGSDHFKTRGYAIIDTPPLSEQVLESSNNMPRDGHSLKRLREIRLIDENESYQLNIHQIRVIANAEFKGVTVPEGPHRDGHEFSVIGIAVRHNVTGGETQVIDPVSRQIVHQQLLDENQAALIDDERYLHYATDIAPVQGTVGHRDIWVIEINRWHKRAYGPVHERRASEATLSVEATA